MSSRRSTRRFARSSTQRRILPSTIQSPMRPSFTPTSIADYAHAKPPFGVLMPIQVLMPALSPTMEKGNLAKWLKKEGDKIAPGDVIAEIETDKATMEVEAVDEGTLGKILVAEGTADVAVNTPIAVILGDGEDKASLKDVKPSPQQKAAESASPTASATRPEERAKAPISKTEDQKTKAPEPPRPQAAADPAIPEGTEMVTMTM